MIYRVVPRVFPVERSHDISCNLDRCSPPVEQTWEVSFTGCIDHGTWSLLAFKMNAKSYRLCNRRSNIQVLWSSWLDILDVLDHQCTHWCWCQKSEPRLRMRNMHQPHMLCRNYFTLYASSSASRYNEPKWRPKNVSGGMHLMPSWHQVNVRDSRELVMTSFSIAKECHAALKEQWPG